MDVRIIAPEGVSINEKRDRSKTAPGSSDLGVFLMYILLHRMPSGCADFTKTRRRRSEYILSPSI